MCFSGLLCLPGNFPRIVIFAGKLLETSLFSVNIKSDIFAALNRNTVSCTLVFNFLHITIAVTCERAWAMWQGGGLHDGT